MITERFLDTTHAASMFVHVKTILFSPLFVRAHANPHFIPFLVSGKRTQLTNTPFLPQKTLDRMGNGIMSGLRTLRPLSGLGEYHTGAGALSVPFQEGLLSLPLFKKGIRKRPPSPSRF